MSNQHVTLRIDSRVFYALLAVVAVLGIFGIGWWLGNQLNGGDQQAAVDTQVTTGTGSGPSSADAPVSPIQATTDPATISGKPPVSVEEVPVGEGESRLWIEDLEDSNWTYDFGSIPSDQPSEHDFTVSNKGNAELVIKEASASCGCTAALVQDPSVSPGESTIVRVKYDPRVNREYGKFVKKTVRISSNDPIVPLVEFTITADVAAQ